MFEIAPFVQVRIPEVCLTLTKIVRLEVVGNRHKLLHISVFRQFSQFCVTTRGVGSNVHVYGSSNMGRAIHITFMHTDNYVTVHQRFNRRD